MFELSVACKYLIPRRRQLSVSIISLISVLVIALVVWLIVVFFSVTNGLEKNWIHKLTALTAPVRITPTDAYYHSYYFLIDQISDASNFSPKTIREKQEALTTDPYDPTIDEEVPSYWPPPDRTSDGSLKDLVKLAFSSLKEIKGVPGIQGQDFELTATHIRLHLLRHATTPHLYESTVQSSLSYPAYLGNFDGKNLHLGDTLLPIEAQDLNNLLQLIGLANEDTDEEIEKDNGLLNPDILQKRLKNLFHFVTIKRLKTYPFGWTIPRLLLPTQGQWEVCAILRNQQVVRLVAPQQAHQCLELQRTLEEQGFTVALGRAKIEGSLLSISLPQQPEKPLSPYFTLTLAGDSHFSATLDPHSIEWAKRVEDLSFWVEIPLQGHLLKGKIFYRGLEIDAADLHHSETAENFPLWVHRLNQTEGLPSFILPKDPEVGEGILLPKSFRDAGVFIGDRGSLSYLAPTASMLQEQHIPIYVAGFYDPGIIPIGGKFILANPEITSFIRSSLPLEDRTTMTNGINIRFDHLDQASEVKTQLQEAFKAQGIHRYWTVETYREYEFTKEIIQELQSQKNLFMLIAIVIILVACSNIISMLIILVNDKKIEIGILRSMGASSQSIALIFGLAGAAIGVVGSVIGIAAAIVTLHHLETLIGWLSRLQGHTLLNSAFYGQAIPHELSLEALSFVLVATGAISLLAGIVPAIKACLLRPSHILRATGD